MSHNMIGLEIREAANEQITSQLPVMKAMGSKILCAAKMNSQRRVDGML